MSVTFSPSRTFAPDATAESGVSLLVTVTASLSQSLLAYSATSLMFVDVTVLSWSFLSADYAEFASVSRSLTVVHTVVQTVIAVPVYVRTVLPVRVNIVVPPTTEDAGMGTGTLLGVVVSAGAAAAILVGIVVYLVRHQADPEGDPDALSDDDEPLAPTVTTHDATSERVAASYTAGNDHLSESLSSCSAGPEDDELFV
jgi:hypothetical protein